MNSNRCSPRTNSTPRVSTMDAHYTSQPVVQSMWKAAERLGFPWRHRARTVRWRRRFLGLQPEGLRGDTRFIAAEYEPLTAAIAGAVPAGIDPAGRLPDHPASRKLVRSAIGNPPFGKSAALLPRPIDQRPVDPTTSSLLPA